MRSCGQTLSGWVSLSWRSTLSRTTESMLTASRATTESARSLLHAESNCNGLIYESDITRGLIDWGLSDRALAGARRLSHLNPQTEETSFPARFRP
jgi:hypothetical protein